MANTYFQTYYHLVFAVKNRESLICEKWEQMIFKHIMNVAEEKGNKVYAIDGTTNHIHILVSIHPKIAVSNFVQSIKIQSSIIAKKYNPYFEWQDGYAVFTYSKSLLPTVIRYIQNQKEHHKVEKFSDEMESMLQKAGIDYQKEYILKDV